MSDDVLSIIYLLLILALILPGFVYANKNKKVLIKKLFFKDTHCFFIFFLCSVLANTKNYF